MSFESCSQPMISRPDRGVCPCAINCAVNRSLSRRLFTFLYPQACGRKRAATRSDPSRMTLTAVLAIAALAAGVAGAETVALRLTLVVFAVAIASWAVVLHFSAGMPMPLALAIVAIQASTLAVLYAGAATPAGHSWEGGLARGLAIANFVFWGSRPLFWTRNRSPIRLVLDAALVGILGAHCVAQIGLLISLRSFELLAGYCGVASGLALLCFVGKQRLGRPRGWFEAGYLTTI